MDPATGSEADSIGPREQLSYLYKEHERLHGVIEKYSESAFDDVKLLAVLGLVFAWDPIVSLVKTPPGSSESGILLIGFVIILAASAIIAIRNLLKQSIMIYNLYQLEHYECQLRGLLEQNDKKTFRWVEEWTQWYRIHHIYIAAAFYLLYSVAVIAFSVTVLYWRTTSQDVVIYVAIAILISICPLWAARSLYSRLQAIGETPSYCPDRP